ncbi:hypothetical protein ACQ4PT_032906 [Festuca glaucescens]
MQSRRQHAAAILSVMALLFFVCIPAGLIASMSQWRHLPLGLRAVRGGDTTTARRPNNANNAPGPGNGTCVFRGGVSSPARSLGWLPASGRHAYTCIIPEPVRSHHNDDAPAPVLVFAASTVITACEGASGRSSGMLNWSDRIVYESVAIDGGDVLVFAKGVNTRKKVNLAAEDIRCLYYHGDEGNAVASLPATTSAQQVFRCPPPPATTAHLELRVTLVLAGEEEPIPSLATYDPPRHHASSAPGKKKKRLICACTMIRDMAKFLREWVVYHAAVGVDRFYVYDNGSEDDLADEVRRLTSSGFDISTKTWPWPKTQEAALSHGAAVHRDACEWMVFIDADEFIFSPHWARSENPAKPMLRSVVASVKQDVGQVSLWCADFGPSGQTTHPKEGVTQGYTCRRKTMERRKSFVRLTAVDESLVNSIHTFTLKPGFQAGWNTRVRVNHYKYQAWEEFKVKFHRRAPAYTADWTDKVELGSNDRTPGLGFEPVEPTGWPQKFCDMNDTLLRDVTRRWFGVGFANNFAPPQIAGTNPGS